MNPWSRINLTLAVSAALLLAVVLWPVEDGDQARLTALDIAQVSRLRIERGDRLVLALQHVDGDWRLDYPTEGPALQRRVEQLLAVARAPVQSRYPAGDDLAPYGLDHPQAVLQLDDLRLAFGQRDATQHSRYVLADGEIHVIDDLYFNLLGLPASHFAAD